MEWGKIPLDLVGRNYNEICVTCLSVGSPQLGRVGTNGKKLFVSGFYESSGLKI
jgi:hypothetical protein